MEEEDNRDKRLSLVVEVEIRLVSVADRLNPFEEVVELVLDLLDVDVPNASTLDPWDRMDAAPAPNKFREIASRLSILGRRR
jgi:hypothetical protein